MILNQDFGDFTIYEIGIIPFGAIPIFFWWPIDSGSKPHQPKGVATISERNLTDLKISQISVRTIFAAFLVFTASRRDHEFIALAKRTSGRNPLHSIIGRTERERERRKHRAVQIASWTFVAIVVTLVVMVLGQFVTRMWIHPPVTSERERTDMIVRKGERIQLTVLNGSGQPNVARKFTDYLRARKFDVVEMSNYKSKDIERTVIYDRVNDTLSSHKVAYALGIDAKNIFVEVDTNAFVDATVVIGKDYPSLNPMK